MAGATAFAVFAAAVVTQILNTSQSPRRIMTFGITVMMLGWPSWSSRSTSPSPRLVMFPAGGVITGAGAGAPFKGVVATVMSIVSADQHDEILAGMFLPAMSGSRCPGSAWAS